MRPFAKPVNSLVRVALLACSALLAACQGSSNTAKLFAKDSNGGAGAVERPVQLLANESAPTSGTQSSGTQSSETLASGGAASLRMEVNERQLAKAVERYRLNKKQKKSPYRSVGVDLNGDGKAEILALLEGEDWCTTTGCTLALFEKGKFGYRPVATIRRVWGPLIVTNERRNGWSDLVVGTGKRSFGHRVRLRFGSRGYPGNAVTLTPMPTDIEVNGEVLIERAELMPQLASNSNP